MKVVVAVSVAVAKENVVPESVQVVLTTRTVEFGFVPKVITLALVFFAKLAMSGSSALRMAQPVSGKDSMSLPFSEAMAATISCLFGFLSWS